MTATLSEIESRIAGLTTDEQLWLMERLAHRLRRKGNHDREAWERDLALMAADPEIQGELRAIEEEFAATQTDGLENA